MEFRVKTDGVCDYTGDHCPVLVRITDREGRETGWLSQDALVKALQMISALLPNQRAVPIVEQHPIPAKLPILRKEDPAAAPPQEEEDLPANRYRPPAPHTAELDRPAVEAFKVACQHLQEDPPPDLRGEKSGVAEIHIRQLVTSYKSRFRDPANMWPVLNQIFGIPKDRFPLLLRVNRERDHGWED